MNNLENQIKEFNHRQLGAGRTSPLPDIGSEDPATSATTAWVWDSVDALELGLAVQKPSASSSTVKTITCAKTSPTSKHWPSSSRAAKHKGETI